MRYLSGLFFLIALLTVSACAQVSSEPLTLEKTEVTSNIVGLRNIGLEDFGLEIDLPPNLGILEAWDYDSGDVRIYEFLEKETNSLFHITTYKNYCNLNDIDKFYVWGHLKGCMNYEKRTLVDRYGENIDFDYHVYSAQAVYFKRGSFISPTIIYGTKYKPRDKSKYLRSKALAYAYLLGDAYYVVEYSFSSPEDDFSHNNKVLATLIKSVIYPQKEGGQ